MGHIGHNRLHDIDDTAEHNGVSGATENNLVSFDANALPKDSSITSSSVSTHLAASNPHSGSAASGANGDITSFTNLTGNISDGSDTVDVTALAGAVAGDLTCYIFESDGSTITTGAKKWYKRVPYDCTITAVEMVADQSGSIVVDIWRTTYANFDAGATHPVDGDSITASAEPTISTATKSQDSTLTGWTTSLTAGDYLEAYVDSVTSLTKVVLTLIVTKTGS